MGGSQVEGIEVISFRENYRGGEERVREKPHEFRIETSLGSMGKYYWVQLWSWRVS
jgi:hypothetical protein